MSILKHHRHTPPRAAWALPVVAGIMLISLAVVEPQSAGPEILLTDPGPSANEYDKGSSQYTPAGKRERYYSYTPAGKRERYYSYTPAGNRGSYSYNSNFSGTMTMKNQRVTYRYGFIDGIFVFEESIDGDIDLHIEVEGDIEFSKDGTAIVDMDPDGFALIETRDRGSRLSLEVTADDDGKPQYEWRVNRRTRPLDEDGREWMRDYILDAGDAMTVPYVVCDDGGFFKEVRGGTSGRSLPVRARSG